MAALLNVVVLAGGDTAEREVSLDSGRAVTWALSQRGHRVTPIDPAETLLAEYSWGDVDVVFLALHGPFGEDGQIQAILDRIRVPYTGSGAAASRLAFSKSASKECFFTQGIPTPSYVLIHQSDSPVQLCNHAESIGFPLVVKPDSQGSSIGVSIVRSLVELTAAVELCFRYDAHGLIESAIEGTEWTVGLLDDRILPALQIETDREYFDFNAKYESETTRYLFEFDVGREVVKDIESVAQRACAVLGTQGLARVDLRLDQENRPWVLEVNTIPGLTDHSLVPKSAARLGISFGELCERALRSCLSASVPQPSVAEPSVGQPQTQ